MARGARGRLLPVGYFHVVFTLPAEIAPIAYQNKTVVYDLLFRTAAETLLTIAADPEAPRRAHRLDRRAPQLGLGDDPSSARPHDRAGRRDIARRVRAGCAADPASSLPVRVLSVCSGGSSWPGSPTPRGGRLAFFGEIDGLPRRKAFAGHLAPLGRRTGSSTPSRPCRARSGARLSCPLHSPRRHREQPLVAFEEHGVTFRYKDYRRNGQARYRTMTLDPTSSSGASCSTMSELTAG